MSGGWGRGSLGERLGTRGTNKNIYKTCGSSGRITFLHLFYIFGAYVSHIFSVGVSVGVGMRACCGGGGSSGVDEAPLDFFGFGDVVDDEPPLELGLDNESCESLDNESPFACALALTVSFVGSPSDDFPS